MSSNPPQGTDFSRYMANAPIQSIKVRRGIPLVQRCQLVIAQAPVRNSPRGASSCRRSVHSRSSALRCMHQAMALSRFTHGNWWDSFFPRIQPLTP